MAARGVLVSYETVRRWCDKFGKQYADGLRKRRARTGDKWHLDEVFLKINDVTHYLWRAVDENGVVLDILANQSGIGLPLFDSFLSCCGTWSQTARHYYEQAPQLRNGKTGRDARRCSSTTSVLEQSD